MTYYVIRTDGGDGALMAFDTQEAASKYAWQNWDAAPDDVQLARFADPRFVFCVATGERYRHGDLLRFKVVEDIKAIAHMDWARAVLFEVGQDALVEYDGELIANGGTITRAGREYAVMGAVMEENDARLDGLFNDDDLKEITDSILASA